MCIPNQFTIPRGSLVACMLPRELRWEEVAPPHNGMTQCLARAGVIIMYHVKCLRNDSVRFTRHYINGLLLLLLLLLLYIIIIIMKVQKQGSHCHTLHTRSLSKYQKDLW